MELGISFGGIEYRASDTAICAVCGKTLSRPWIINENKTGRRFYFCEQHYMEWENARDNMLAELGERFRQKFIDTGA